MDIYDDEDDFDYIMELIYDSESDENVIRGSRPGKSANLDRGRADGATQLYRDYFSPNPTYPEHMFSRRFRLSRQSFIDICNKLEQTNRYFQQRKDCTGLLGFNKYQKCTAAMRMIAYGVSGDAVDDYLRISSSTAIECVKKFAETVVKEYRDEYLRPPTPNETAILLQRGEVLGFPGMIGSIDCCKWLWKNCPTAYHGQYQGKEKVPAVTMEAIADDRLYFWHAFFGVPGSNNDINALEASPLFGLMSNGEYPPACEYVIGEEKRNKPYWLSDGIYPKYPCFLHSVLNPCTKDEKYFAAVQEGRRKDIERAFGVLQAKFHIVAVPSRLWKKEDMCTIMYCCVILHNMVVSQQRALVRLNSEEKSGSNGIDVDGDIEHCFIRNDRAGPAVVPGSIAAMCSTHEYLHSARDYMATRRLVFKHVVSQRKE